MKKNLQKIQLIASFLFLLILCFCFLFFYKKINNNNKNADLEMQAWQSEANRRDNIIFLDQSLKENAGARESLEEHFSKSSDVVPFLDTLGGLASSAGVTEDINLVDTGTNNDRLIVELKAAGSFNGVYKFLTLLENSPYELDFLTMDLHQVHTAIAVATPTPPTTGKSPSPTASPTVTAPAPTQTTSWEAIFRIQLLTFTP